MTAKELSKEFTRIITAKSQAERAIIEHVRPLISVLQDHGLPKAANDLRELYFQLDANSQEIGKLIVDNPHEMSEYLSQKISKNLENY